MTCWSLHFVRCYTRVSRWHFKNFWQFAAWQFRLLFRMVRDVRRACIFSGSSLKKSHHGTLRCVRPKLRPHRNTNETNRENMTRNNFPAHHCMFDASSMVTRHSDMNKMWGGPYKIHEYDRCTAFPAHPGATIPIELNLDLNLLSVYVRNAFERLSYTMQDNLFPQTVWVKRIVTLNNSCDVKNRTAS